MMMMIIITRPSVNYAKDWLDHSFLFPGLKKSFTLDVITRWQSTSIFLCIKPFSAWWWTNEQTNKRTNEQLGDPRASLLLSSEKAILCKQVFWALPLTRTVEDLPFCRQVCYVPIASYVLLRVLCVFIFRPAFWIRHFGLYRVSTIDLLGPGQWSALKDFQFSIFNGCNYDLDLLGKPESEIYN